MFMKLFGKILERQGNEHYNTGIAFFNGGQYEEAVAEFEKAIESISSKKDPYYNLGLFYAAEARAHLGLAHFKKGELEKAEQEFRKALSESPNYPDLHYYLGVIYEKSNRHREAIKELEEALAINTHYSEARCYLAVCLHAVGEEEAAKSQLRDVKLAGYDLPLSLSLQNNNHIPEEVIAELKQIPKKKSECVVHVDTAVSCYNRGLRKEALAELEKAVAGGEPRRVGAHDGAPPACGNISPRASEMTVKEVGSPIAAETACS